jgi:mercuric ion binding protein
MPKVFLFAILAGSCIFMTAIAQAQVSALTVAVDGMACPFCAFGVEKRLKTVKGVAAVAVNMQAGTASLKAGEGESIYFQGVPEAVKDAGFTAGTMRIKISGVIEKSITGMALRYDGPPLPLAAANNEMAARLRDGADRGATVVLHGVLEKKKADWVLQAETIELAP